MKKQAEGRRGASGDLGSTQGLQQSGPGRNVSLFLKWELGFRENGFSVQPPKAPGRSELDDLSLALPSSVCARTRVKLQIQMY